MPLLAVEGLSVEINSPVGPVPVLKDLALTLARGERLGIVGESGCGKSMTALALIGLLPDAARARGRILFDGRDLLAAEERALCRLRGRRLAMVFQEPMTALNPVQSIGRQVAEGLRLHVGLGRAAAEARAVALLDRVGLPPARFAPDLFPHQLSGGQRQRVVIAMALACGPEVLIADEPTTALDVTIQAQILDLIDEVVAESAMALIMISHDLGVIARITDRMAVMYAGRIVESGPTAGVFTRMAHPYTRGLFAAMPQLAAVDTPRGRLATIPGTVPDPTPRAPGCAFAPRCPRATGDCHHGLVPVGTIGPGHLVACHHPHHPTGSAAR